MWKGIIWNFMFDLIIRESYFEEVIFSLWVKVEVNVY